MALVPCKECGREISTEAEFCPHCGKKRPPNDFFRTPTKGETKRAFNMGCLLTIVLFIGYVFIDSHMRNLPKTSNEETPPQRQVAQNQDQDSSATSESESNEEGTNQASDLNKEIVSFLLNYQPYKHLSKEYTATIKDGIAATLAFMQKSGHSAKVAGWRVENAGAENEYLVTLMVRIDGSEDESTWFVDWGNKKAVAKNEGAQGIEQVTVITKDMKGKK